MKECICIRYSLQKFVKEELMCREKESHKSHVNHISWFGLTCIMIGVERGGGRREKGVIMQNNWLRIARTPFPFPFFLSLPLCILRLPRRTCLDYRSLRTRWIKFQIS